MSETGYRDQLDAAAAIDVRFTTAREAVIEYSVVLLALDGAQWRTVRLYDNAHGAHDMHRYTRSGDKQPAQAFHQGTAAEAMRDAVAAIRAGHQEMIEAWRR
jgi:hypothetical protein